MHVNMLDPANILQQEAIGILGVNLIYAAFYELETKESFRAATNFAAISNTGSLIFTYTSRGFAIWDATGRLRCLKPGDSYYTMAISPDNHWLVAAPLIN